MTNGNWKGKILLRGFDKEEIERIKKLLNKYDRRLGRLGYKEIRLTLQRHKKGREGIYLNEIKGLGKIEKNLIHAEITSHEIFSAVEKVMNRLEREALRLLKLESRRRGKRK